jgi:hypothetical protein
MARKTTLTDLHAADYLINGDDGLRAWALGYDYDGALGAVDGDLINNIVAVAERAQRLASLLRARAHEAGVHKGDCFVLTTSEIRKIVTHMLSEATGRCEECN